ncbi:hypothetical protein Tco_1457186 [Tanacetum coccineum]
MLDKLKLDEDVEADVEEVTKEVIKRYKTLREKNDPGVFVLPICLEAKIDSFTLADTGSNINVLLYHIYTKPGREEAKPLGKKITMLDYSKAQPMGILRDVVCQVGVTTILAKILIVDIPVDKDVSIVIRRKMETDEDDDPNDIANIFKIEGNLFDLEIPLCKAFNEFNYLLKIDTYLFTFDIQEIKTYKEYELNNNMIVDLKEPCFENFHELDYDVLVKLEECWWKVNAYENAPFARWENHDQGPYANAITEKVYDLYLDINRIFGRNYRANNANNAQDNKKEHHDPSICNIRRFEMMKYSFDHDDKYFAIKELEHSDHSRINVDACKTYRELFRIMDEGWLVTKAKE